MGKPAESLSAFEKLVNNNKVVAISGPLFSSNTKAVMTALDKYEIPLVTGGSTAPDITEEKLPGQKWLFRVIPHDGLVQDATSRFIFDDLKARKIAMLAVNDDWGRQSTQLIGDSLAKRGAKVIPTEFYSVGQSNYLPQLTKITGLNPDVLFLVGSSQDGSVIVRQAKEIGYKKAIFGLGAFASNVFIDLAREAGEGVYSAVQYVDTIDTPQNKAFVAEYKKLYPNMPAPSKYVWGSYTATMVLLQAINQAGTTDPKKVVDALAHIKYKGVTGDVAFDAKHQAHPDLYITVIRNGRAVIQRTASTI